MFLNFDITHLPHDVKELAAKAAKWTAQIREDLTKGEVKTAAEYIPDGEKDREALISILDIAIKNLTTISTFDDRGVTSRLQAAGSDLTKILHSSEKHTLSFYIVSFEIVWRDLFGGK